MGIYLSFRKLTFILSLGFGILLAGCSDSKSNDAEGDPSWSPTGAIGCSVVDYDYIITEDNEDGIWYYFYEVEDVNESSLSYGQKKWLYDETKDALCSTGVVDPEPQPGDPDWQEFETACSVSESNYIAPQNGEVGYYFFYREKDMNEESDTFGEITDWKRDATRDGSCLYDGDDFVPVFINTNITTGTFSDYTTFGSRIVVSENGTAYTGMPVLEYIDGMWVLPLGLQNFENDIYYPKIKFAPNGNLFISCAKGYLYQENGNTNVIKANLWFANRDMSGGLGGSSTNFFVSAGVDSKGIFKWENGVFTEVYSNGCYYSIEALNENEIFFGSNDKSDKTIRGYGVIRYNNGEFFDTNLTDVAYNLTLFNGDMYAAYVSYSAYDPAKEKVYKWNGSSFQEIYDGRGVLKVSGNNLYLLTSDEILQYNGSGFVSFLSGAYSDIVLHEEVLYVFSSNGTKYYKDNEWNDLADVKGTKGISSVAGLFLIGNPGGGIQKMVKQPK